MEIIIIYYLKQTKNSSAYKYIKLILKFKNPFKYTLNYTVYIYIELYIEYIN